MRQKTFQTRYISYVLLALTCLLTACSGGGSSSEELDPPAPNPTPNPTPENQEIKLNANVWNMMEGMRATFYDAGTITSGSFTASAYVENTITAYINPTTVNWNSTEWQWSDGKHYWPASGALDFFAYMPATKPSYISSITYNARSPQFVCEDLPMTYNSASPTEGQGSGLQEFVYAMTINQDKANQGASGVTMKFRHPFARIKFQLSASHPDIQINSITFKNLKTGGTCTMNNTGIADTYYYTTSVWPSLTGSSNFVMTLSGAAATFNNNPISPLKQIGVDLIMVPQTWGGEIEVNATWVDWGESIAHTVRTILPGTNEWQPGYNYTYTFTITETDLIVDTTKYTEQW